MVGFLANVDEIPPILPTFGSPVYSNIGYSILGLVLQNITSSSFEAALNETFIRKLKLSRTQITTPPQSWGILTSPESLWGSDLGYYTP